MKAELPWRAPVPRRRANSPQAAPVQEVMDPRFFQQNQY
jgi:hypothetical protein